MKRIWKYPLGSQIEQVLSIPEGFKVLCLKEPNKFNPACLYAMVDDTKAKREVKVYIIGTGHAIDENKLAQCEYAGTFIDENWNLVWHVFIEPVATREE